MWSEARSESIQSLDINGMLVQSIDKMRVEVMEFAMNHPMARLASLAIVKLRQRMVAVLSSGTLLYQKLYGGNMKIEYLEN